MTCDFLIHEAISLRTVMDINFYTALKKGKKNEQIHYVKAIANIDIKSYIYIVY